MDLNALLNSCAEAVADDADIAAFCQAEYGQAISVYVKFPKVKTVFLGSGQCPAVVFFPLGKEYHMDGGDKYWLDVIGFQAVVYDERIRQHQTISTVTENVGVANIETLRKKIMTAIANAVAAAENSRIADAQGEYIEYEDPGGFYIADWAASVRTPYRIGMGNPFTRE